MYIWLCYTACISKQCLKVRPKKGKTMKVKVTKLVKAAKKLATQKVQAVKTKAAKAVKMVSAFYKQLRGTPLNLCNLRKQDFVSQKFVPAPKATKPMVFIAQSRFGICISELPVQGTVARIDNKRGFDLKQIPGGTLMAPAEAAKWAKKNGVAHTWKRGKHSVVGTIVGDMKKMYVACYDGRRFDTLETRAIRDGRNSERLFALEK